MRPVTDKYNISRAKLAYLIDSTAAPVCIIAPISSWAAAVSGFVKGENGISIFIQSIPYNFYALLTLIMMLLIIFLGIDYGPMKVHEDNALKGDLFTTGITEEAAETMKKGEKIGSVIDLVLPIVMLIICCVIGMIYTGGFFEVPSPTVMLLLVWFLALRLHCLSLLPSIFCVSPCPLRIAWTACRKDSSRWFRPC